MIKVIPGLRRPNKLRYKDGIGDPRGFKSFLDSGHLWKIHRPVRRLCEISQEWYRI